MIDSFIHVGPQLPPEPSESFVSDEDVEVISFLDQSTKTSVVYICFGTTFWPPNAEQTRLLFETMDSMGLRALVIRCPTAPKDVKGEIEVGMKKLGVRGIISDWVPQYRVLGHPVSSRTNIPRSLYFLLSRATDAAQAIIAFMTHCGSNSAMEAMLRAVPMSPSLPLPFCS